MDADLEAEPGHKPVELPPTSKLEAGYVRYIRIIPTEGPDGEICFETCIRRSTVHDDSGDDRPDNEDNDDDEDLAHFFYSAVSYTWGEKPVPQHHIIVDGHKRMVADNLWYFLQRTNLERLKTRDARSYRDIQLGECMDELEGLKTEERKHTEEYWKHDRDFRIVNQERLLRRPREIWASIEGARKRIRDVKDLYWSSGWLWVDALCIDQSNAEERTHQVAIMSKIFGGADQVICWLGPAYDSSEHAMAALQSYSGGDSGETSTNYGQSLVRPGLSEAICGLCERPYWSRLWIFQELKYAKRIRLISGDTSISWNSFKNIWRVIVDNAAMDEDGMDRLRQSLATRMITLRTKPLDFSLWNLLRETRSLKCADQRDKVYALLSVATEGHEGIEADYHASVEELAHHILRSKHALTRPRSLDEVIQDCQFLADTFEMSDLEIFPLHYGRAYIKSSQFAGFWTAWVQDHNHFAVREMLETRR